MFFIQDQTAIWLEKKIMTYFLSKSKRFIFINSYGNQPFYTILLWSAMILDRFQLCNQCFTKNPNSNWWAVTVSAVKVIMWFEIIEIFDRQQLITMLKESLTCWIKLWFELVRVFEITIFVNYEPRNNSNKLAKINDSKITNSSRICSKFDENPTIRQNFGSKIF